jgi:acyl carrier protein
MEIQQFIDNVVSQFEDVDSKSVMEKTNLRDIQGWSSLVAFSIIAMIEEEYMVQIKGDDIQKSQTIEDLFNTVKSKK